MGATPFTSCEATIEESRPFATSGGRLVHLEFPETQAQHYGDETVFYGRFRVVLSSPAPNGAAAEQ